jgi:hypothetical protein
LLIRRIIDQWIGAKMAADGWPALVEDSVLQRIYLDLTVHPTPDQAGFGNPGSKRDKLHRRNC